MELEDQKPKDIILNEEIKQEKEESLESFKEERLAEDEYFELITPKLKEVNGSSAVRMESEEQKSKNTLWDREIKQETDDFLENAKEEPIEEKYSEQTMAKLEEVREQSTSVMSNNPMQSFFIVPQEDFPKLDVEPPIEAIARFQKSNSYPPQVNRQINPVQKLFMLNVVPKLDVESERDQGEMHVERKNKNDFGFQNSRCSVCFQFCCRQNMKYVSMEEDKLVIMIGCVLLETYTLVQAQSFMSDERRRIRICYVHFSEAVNEIYNVLNIKNPYEISSCSSELMDTLLVTVNALYPQTGTVQFRHIIYNFVRRNISRKPINTKGELNKKQQNYHCSLCSRKQNFQNVKQVTLETEKLLIMIGCILRGEYSFEEAHSFIFRTKCSVICHIHFPEVLNEIYKALNIKNPDEVSSCSTELLTNLMITINRLCPQFELWQLRITPIQMDLEEQKPKDIILKEEIKQEMEDFLENVKEKLIDGHFPEKESLKLEQNREKVSQEFDEKSQVSTPETSSLNDPKKFQRSRCSVCSQMESEKNMKRVSSEDKKFIIMIGCVLRGSYTIVEAQQFLSQKNPSFICYNHFTDTIDEIYKALNIKNSHEIASCSVDMIDNLMITVNALCSEITKSQFCDLMCSFIHKNCTKRIHLDTQGKQTRKHKNYLCSICLKMQNSENGKRVPSSNEKLVIMIGRVLRGDSTVEQGKLYVSNKKPVFICQDHFDEAFTVIRSSESYRMELEEQKSEDIQMEEYSGNTEDIKNSRNPENGEQDSQKISVKSQVLTSETSSVKDPKTFQKTRNYWCPVCSKLENVKNMKQHDAPYFYAPWETGPSMEDEKLVIMIGCVLRGSYTIDEAQRFLSRKNITSICYIHFSEMIDDIYKSLNIKNPDEIDSCSVDMVNNLMKTVNALRSEILISQFFDMLNGFIKRNCSSKQNHTRTRGLDKRNHYCHVCKQLQVTKNLKNVSLKDERQVIMIGCVLRGDFTIEQAEKFLSEKKTNFICYAHFIETIDDIYYILNIKKPEEIPSCSLDSMKNLMDTVTKVSPSVTTLHFREILNSFVTRNEKYRDKTD